MKNILDSTLSADEFDHLASATDGAIWYVADPDTGEVFAAYEDADGVDWEEVRNAFDDEYPVSDWSDRTIAVWYREAPGSEYVRQYLELADGGLRPVEM